MNQTKKWNWKMDYCQKYKLPPAQDWAWNRAEKEWRKENEKQHDCRSTKLEMVEYIQ